MRGRSLRRPWSDSLRALGRLDWWKGREAERVRGLVVKKCDVVRAEQRVRGLVRKDMIFFFFFVGGWGDCMKLMWAVE